MVVVVGRGNNFGIYKYIYIWRKKDDFFLGGVLDFKSHKSFQKYYHVLYGERMPHQTMFL